ncbi:S-layer homology domain-containing protein [Candidatus Peregrinibacteria bacterium]|nr:S-layer homology domain-containing protein [Candidatus Peregrinibacteria bacterium]
MRRFAIFFLLFVTALPTALAFQDIPQDDSHFLALQQLQEMNAISGYPDNTFRPEDPVNRAEIVKIILGFYEGKEPEGEDIYPRLQAFKDVHPEDWFFLVVQKAFRLKIIQGETEGAKTFSRLQFYPGRFVNVAEFFQMLFKASGITPQSRTSYADLPPKAWFTPALAYAADLGLIHADAQNKIYPARFLTRGEVADILYLFTVLKHGKDVDFLLAQANRQFNFIEVAMQSGKIAAALTASEFALNFATQASKVKPQYGHAKAFVKLAEGYRLLLQAFQAGAQGNNDSVKTLTDQAIATATAAWEADHDVQPLARHLKDRAREIVGQAL